MSISLPMQVLWQHPDVLDLEKVYTNDIHAMANTYGIEAACKAIIKASRKYPGGICTIS